jgi:hypothetical protein
MKYIKLFEAFSSEPSFYRFNHVDVLNGKDEIIYNPKERKMVGPEDVNHSLVQSGFPDKNKCIHFMDSLAFDPSYKGLYGRNIYQIEIDENSKLGWSFLIPINDWFYKGYPFRQVLNNPTAKELLDSEYVDMSYDKGDIDEMRDILIDFEVIGSGTLNDLKMNKFFGKQPVFVWTSDSVKIKPYVEESRVKETKPYKKEVLLTKDDFLNLDIPLSQIPNFYSSELGKKISRFKDTAPFDLKREEALNLLRKWKY